MSNCKESSHKRNPQAQPGISAPSALPISVLAGVTIIIVTVVLAYFPSLSCGFIWDDDAHLTNNQFIKAPNGLYKFWCTTEPADYYPMSYSSLWIEWRLWGMNATGYHVTNLVLHIIEALLIWLILRKLSIPGAFLAATIFAVHPVNVESVAWIAERKNMLAMLFFLLSILCYLKFITPAPLWVAAKQPAATPTTVHRPPPTFSSFILHPSSFQLWYWLSLAAFALGMLSKASLGMLPVLLLGIVWWRRKVTRWDIVRTAPFFLVALVLTGVAILFHVRILGEGVRNAGFIERSLGAGGVVWFYLYKALLPVDLSFVYPQWHIQVGNLLWWMPLLAMLLVTAVLWLYRESWSRPFLFAWGFFGVSLVPVMGFTDVYFMKYSLAADHYQHIAIIGVIALATAGWSVWNQQARGGAHWAAIVLAIASVCVLTFLTWRQCGLYQNEITLYKDTLKKNPDCWMAHTNLGLALAQTGRLKEAIEHYERSLALKSDDAELCSNLGVILVKSGRLEDAIDKFKLALKLKPDNPAVRTNLGNVLNDLGRPQEAIEQFEQALSQDPKLAAAHINLGIALIKTSKPLKAIEHYRQALQLEPNSIEAHANLAIAYAQTKQSVEAIAAAQKALNLARSNGQTALAKKLENWLNSYRAGLTRLPNAPPSSKSAPSSP